MGNPLYESMHGGNNAPIQNPVQSPPMSMQEAMNKLQSNSASIMRQIGFNIPDDVQNNPQSVASYLVRSGQITSPFLQQIRSTIGRIMGF